MDDLHRYLTFKPTLEEYNAINYLDLKISRLNASLDINIFNKTTTTDTTHPTTHWNKNWEHLDLW
jgi:hypothetical protein